MPNKKTLKEVLAMKSIRGTEKAEIEAQKISKNQDPVITGLDATDRESVIYNRLCIERKINNIFNNMKGWDESILPFVEDTSGKLCNTKIDSFIDELISCHPDYENLSDEQKKLFRLFLYTAIVGPSSLRSCYFIESYSSNFIPASSFRDIIYAAKDSLFTSSDRLAFVVSEENERCYPEDAGGFTYFINEAYQLLTGKPIWDIYSSEELIKVKEKYADIHGIDIRDLEPQENESTEESIYKEMELDSEIIRARCINNDYESYEEENDINIILDEVDYDYFKQKEEHLTKISSDSYKKWKDHLPLNDHFIQSYLELRDALLKIEHPDLASDIALMTDEFIVRKELSPLCFERNFRLFEKQLFNLHVEANDVIKETKRLAGNK